MHHEREQGPRPVQPARPRFAHDPTRRRAHLVVFVVFQVVVVAAGAFFSSRSYDKYVTSGQETLNSNERYDVGNDEFDVGQ